jgi:hypothetical protein
VQVDEQPAAAGPTPAAPSKAAPARDAAMADADIDDDLQKALALSMQVRWNRGYTQLSEDASLAYCANREPGVTAQQLVKRLGGVMLLHGRWPWRI